MSVKKFIKNFIIEQDENLIQLTPEQYKEVLEDVGGVADRVAKLKPYRGKGIVITGPLDVSNNKKIGQLTGIVRVMGRLDISDSNVPNINGIEVDGYVNNYGSTMWSMVKRQELAKKLDELEELRSDDEWNIATGGDDDAERTEALYNFLIEEGIPEEVEDEEGNEVTEDKYFIYPDGVGSYGYGKKYEWVGGSALVPNTYDVYTQDEMDKAAEAYIENLVDDVGYDAFREWVWNDAIDVQHWRRWLYEFYEDDIRSSPDENYDIGLALSDYQKSQVSTLENTIKKLNDKFISGGLTDEENKTIQKKIEGLQNTINNIMEDPEGDYDEDQIVQEINNRVDDYADDIKSFIDDYGFDKKFIMDFIDISELTNTIVSSDGYGILSNNGSDIYEDRINGTWYYVIPTD
jgi:hypothetical protein